MNCEWCSKPSGKAAFCAPLGDEKVSRCSAAWLREDRNIEFAAEAADDAYMETYGPDFDPVDSREMDDDDIDPMGELGDEHENYVEVGGD